MKLPFLHRLGVGVVALWLLTLIPGCTDSAKPVEPVSLAEIPSLVNAAFKDAKDPAKSLASQVVDAVEQKDWAKASVGAEALLSAPGTTAEQNKLVGRCLLAINQQVNEAAAAGNAQAEQLQQVRRAEK